MRAYDLPAFSKGYRAYITKILQKTEAPPRENLRDDAYDYPALFQQPGGMDRRAGHGTSLGIPSITR